MYAEDRRQTLPAVSTPVAGVTNGAENSPHHLDSDAPPSEPVYDDVGDVIEDEDEVAEPDSQESSYDSLQQLTRDIVPQAPPVYEQIRSDDPASASTSDVIAHQHKYPLYLQLLGDDERPPSRKELTKTVRHVCQKYATNSDPKASTL